MWSYLLQVDFGIGTHPGFTDQVHNPFLTLVSREVKSLGKIAATQERIRILYKKKARVYSRDVDFVVYPAIRFTNEVASIIQKFVFVLVQEEIVLRNLHRRR